MSLLLWLFRLVFRCIKWVRRFVTGKGEIERAAAVNDHRVLQQSIRRSKVLGTVSNRVLSQQYSQQSVEQLCALKNIISVEAKNNIKRNLSEISHVLNAISLVEQARAEKYSMQNPRHEEKLLMLWNNLRPNQKLTQRNSTQWIDLGFQDANPATDFRGAGYLGLLNLVQYTKTAQGLECFKTATNKNTHFFFCSAGLFMTMLSSNLLKERRLDRIFYSGNNVLSNFQQLYNKLFNRFHEKWKTTEDKSMMAFNQNLKTFERELRQLSNQQLLFTIG